MEEEEEEEAITEPHSRFVEREPRRFNISALLWDEALPLEALAPADVRLIHDAEDLYVRYADGEQLQPSERIVVRVQPLEGDETWEITVTGEGKISVARPAGYPVAPHCRARFELDARGPRTLISLPFCEFVKPGELGGTPLHEDSWRISVQRLKAGESFSNEMVKILFVGGPTEQRVWMPEKYEEPFFGVSVIRFRTKTEKRKGVFVTMTPSPADFLRTKDPAHAKFRIAKPGPYRLRVRLPKEADIYPSEEEEPIPGEASYAAGTVFLLPNIWRDMVAMEQDVNLFKRAAKEKGLTLEGEQVENISFFEDLVQKSDGYRVPSCREKMEPSFFELLKNIYADVRTGFEEILPDVAAENPRPVEAAGLDLENLLAGGTHGEEEESEEEGATLEGEDEQSEEE